MAQNDRHRYLLLNPVPDETPDSPRLTLEKTSCSNLRQKQLETKTEDICVIRWSKPSGDYIMNFYRPKEVSCKKTESGEHTRCPRGRGAPRGVGHALHPRGGLVSFPDCFLFVYFSKYSKTEKYCLKTVLESVYLPYHIPIPFRSLKRSGKCPLCIPPGLRFQ